MKTGVYVSVGGSGVKVRVLVAEGGMAVAVNVDVAVRVGVEVTGCGTATSPRQEATVVIKVRMTGMKTLRCTGIESATRECLKFVADHA